MKQIPGENGYTLIETLIALVILMIVLTAFIHIITQLLTESRNLTKIQAIDLAESEMERWLLEEDFSESEYSRLFLGKWFGIHKLVRKDMYFNYLTIQVFYTGEKKPVIQLHRVTRKLAHDQVP